MADAPLTPTPAAPVAPAAATPAVPAAAAPATPPEPATPDPATPPTVVADPPAGDTPPVAADFPADWREKLAGTDEKQLKLLKRYASPAAFKDAHFALHQKMSAGELKAALPEKATPEELATWRKDNGIPEKSEDYLSSLDKGLVVSDDDKKRLSPILDAAHGVNAPPAVVAAMVNAYYKNIESVQAERYQKDQEAKTVGEDTLRAEWGAEFPRNRTDIANILAMAPQEVVPDLYGARLADGTPMMSSAPVLRWLVGLAREINPAGTLAPSSGSPGADVATELENIRKMQTDNPEKYWSQPVQKRERELLAAREKIKGRAA